MAVKKLSNNRGIALLIVLLVTALLIALVFEFAYATRISLNSAVNFRDATRASYLARSGIYAFIKSEGVQDMDLKTLIPSGEWGIVPLISEGDTELRVKWEDELGKIRISRIRKPKDSAEASSNPSYDWMVELFSKMSIDQSILDRISENQMVFQLPSELYKVMNDEDFAKIERFITTLPYDIGAGYKININTAAPEVLAAIGMKDIESVITKRKSQPYKSEDITVTAFGNLAKYLTTGTTIYRVSAHASVGGYTKQVEAIVQNRAISYWRAL